MEEIINITGPYVYPKIAYDTNNCDWQAINEEKTGSNVLSLFDLTLVKKEDD